MYTWRNSLPPLFQHPPSGHPWSQPRAVHAHAVHVHGELQCDDSQEFRSPLKCHGDSVDHHLHCLTRAIGVNKKDKGPPSRTEHEVASVSLDHDLPGPNPSSGKPPCDLKKSTRSPPKLGDLLVSVLVYDSNSSLEVIRGLHEKPPWDWVPVAPSKRCDFGLALRLGRGMG